MKIEHVAFVMYPVTDMARAVAFYRDGLGLPGGELTSDFWTEFEVGGTTFGVGTFEQLGTPGTAQSLALEVDDIAAARTELRGRGIEMSEPHELPNCWLAVLEDPDGNRIRLHQAKPR